MKLLVLLFAGSLIFMPSAGAQKKPGAGDSESARKVAEWLRTIALDGRDREGPGGSDGSASEGHPARNVRTRPRPLPRGSRIDEGRRRLRVIARILHLRGSLSVSPQHVVFLVPSTPLSYSPFRVRPWWFERRSLRMPDNPAESRFVQELRRMHSIFLAHFAVSLCHH